METQKSKTVFIEYSTANKGQHFMTVMQNTNGQRNVIGRIYREYDKENKKTTYKATDSKGNQVFANFSELRDIKKQFIENGRSLSDIVPDQTINQEPTGLEAQSKKPEREKELKGLRDKNAEKDKERGIDK